MTVLLSGGGLTGCASYRPEPLPDEPVPFAAAARFGVSTLSVDISQPLTPRSLGLIAVITNPELKAARARVGITDAQAFSAGLLPDPTFSFGFDKPVAGPDTITALSAAIGVDTSSLYLRGPARDQARLAAEQARLDLAWQEWMTAGQARLAAVRVLALERQYDLARQSRRSADDMLGRTLRATARGDLKGDDLQARRLAAADAADRERGLERELAAARLELGGILGLAPGVLLVLVPDENPSLTSPDPAELFAVARDNRPDLAALRAGYASQDARLRGALLEQYPKLDLTLTGARDTAGVRTVGPSVSLTLPLWNRNQGAIAVETATRTQLRAEYEARLSATRSQIAALVSGVEIARRQRADLLAQIEPLRVTVGTMEAAAKRGDLAWSTAEAARQSLLDKELALAGVEQFLAEQAIGLELAVGRPVETR